MVANIEQMLALGEDRPTAVFGFNNLMTMAIVRALKKLEVRIPQDMAVMGFDDWEWAALVEPPITVVAQPTYEMGVKAAEMLVKRMKAFKGQKKAVIKVFKPELIVRKSC